ncbi:chemotaxis protein CheB [Treponema sp. C6A8]|uniref:chemotaxis protein CheB n=1 Tax=Treponema sp. C6A8 TaxID=1410609 RepID=UPI00048A235E|nr:chemotaxis protein CheB [Treponema sp. C6A8]
MSKLRMLIADDSAITRGLFEKAFTQNGFEVVSLVSNGRKAVDFCRETKVDFVLSDYDMPELNGAEATKIITGELGIPVVIYSDDLSVKAECISAGAALFTKKPPLTAYNAQTMNAFVAGVQEALKNVKGSLHTTAESHSIKDTVHEVLGKKGFKVLCIGASTGGPTAVQKVLSGLGNNFPLPVLYTQHLDIGADEKMAKWFCETCPNIPMSLARDGEIAKAGHAYLAPADKHLVIDYVKNELPVLHLSDEPPERFLRPAVNKLFRSAAKNYANNCLAVLMTGMGRDGAEGCKEIIDNGGYTICEDKSTCTVFGMPAAAIELNAATKVFPRDRIAGEVLKLVK